MSMIAHLLRFDVSTAQKIIPYENDVLFLISFSVSSQATIHENRQSIDYCAVGGDVMLIRSTVS